MIEISDPQKSSCGQAGAARREHDDRAGAVGHRRGQGRCVRQASRNAGRRGLAPRRVRGVGSTFKSRPARFAAKPRAWRFRPSCEIRLPEPLATKLVALGELARASRIGISECDYDHAAAVRCGSTCRDGLREGESTTARLPQVLSDIRATFRLNNAGYAIDDLTARSGQTTLRMSCRGSGFEPTSPLALTAEVRRLELDPALMNVLPPALQERWRHYSPAGHDRRRRAARLRRQDLAAAAFRDVPGRVVHALQVPLPAGSCAGDRLC